MNKSTMFEALGKVESNLTMCKCTARLLALVPLDGNPYADELVAIKSALETQLERTHEALDAAYAANKGGEQNDA